MTPTTRVRAPRNLRGDLGLGVPHLEARLLSRRPAGEALSGALLPRGSNSVEVNYTFRAFPTATMLDDLARGDARGLSLQLQSAAAHHPLQPPARVRRRGRRVRRRARAGARRRQARPTALPASAQLQGRSGAARRLPRRACAPRPCRAQACLRVPPRELVQRRDLRDPARAQRRALHRRERRPARRPRSSAPPPTPAIACAATAATAPRRSKPSPKNSPRSQQPATSTSTSSTRTSRPAR